MSQHMRKPKVMNRAQELIAATIASLSCFALVTACTMHKATTSTLNPDAYVNKSDLQGKTFHLVRGVEEADSNNNFYAIPGFAQDFGLVKVDITETELRFLLAFDPTGRDATAKVVASYPITGQFDILRQKNDYNEDTNKVVEDSTTNPWDKRQFMRVDWSKPSSTLSDYNSQVGDNEMKEKNQVLKEDPKFENGHLSFLTEVSVDGPQVNPYLPPFGSYAPEAPQRVTFRTHLIPAKDGDFKPVQYSLADFKHFGYFVTQQDFLDPERGHIESSQKIYAQVYNVCEPGTSSSCSTNKIKWVLSQDFPEVYKPEARAAILAWNNTFKEALGRTDDVVVLDESTQVSLSDPTQNVIAYYDARSGAGLLGVAQGMTDPRTGEKLSSRATVYGDGIRYEEGRIDQLIDLLAQKNDLLALQNVLAAGPNPTSGLKSSYQGTANTKVAKAGVVPSQAVANFNAAMEKSFKDLKPKSMKKLNAVPSVTLSQIINEAGLRSDLNKSSGVGAAHSQAPVSGANTPSYLMGNKVSEMRLNELMSNHPTMFHIPEFDRIGGLEAPVHVPDNSPLKKYQGMGGLENFAMFGEVQAIERRGELRQNYAGVHGVEMVDDATTRFLLREARKAKTPQDLVNEKADLKGRLAKQIFYITLLHEMGHTFGLRHNFMGSADIKHYPPEWSAIKKRLDAKEQGLTDDDLVPYASSSVMDYMDFFEQQAGLGPYDKAAIKYGYRRSLDRKNDETVKAGYMFCSDEQVLSDIRCQRFDRGATVSEIIENKIKSYNQNWAFTHVRNGRLTFEDSERRLFGYYFRNIFLPIRLVFDEMQYALITANRLGDVKSNECPIDFWKDSIDKKEMVNICDSKEAAAHGIDPSSAATYGNAVDSTLKSRDLTPYGLADLLRATGEAQNFFRDVLGTIEPGCYIVNPKAVDAAGNLQMVALDPPAANSVDCRASLASRVKQVSADLTPDQLNAVVEQVIGSVTFVPFGAKGKPYMSIWNETGGKYQLQVAGSLSDKLAAIYAIGVSHLRFDKYQASGMVTNTYLYNFSKEFVSGFFHDLIVGDNVILHQPMNVTLTSGVKITGVAPAKLDVNTQETAAALGLTSLVSDLDMSFQDKLTICAVGDSSCANPGGVQSVHAISSSLNKTYVAIQTPQADSIAFDIVSSMAAITKDVPKMLSAVANVDTNRQKEIDAINGVMNERMRVITNLNVLLKNPPELAAAGLTTSDLGVINSIIAPPGPNGSPAGLPALIDLVQTLAKNPPNNPLAYDSIALTAMDQGKTVTEYVTNAVKKKLSARTLSTTVSVCPEGTKIYPADAAASAASAPGAANASPTDSSTLNATPQLVPVQLDQCALADGTVTASPLQQVQLDLLKINGVIQAVGSGESLVLEAPQKIRMASDQEKRKELIVDYIDNILRLFPRF